MSALTQAALISGIIFVVVVFRSYGRRLFDRKAIILPLAMVAIFGHMYLSAMPLGTTADYLVYAAAVTLGVLFGLAASVATTVERDSDRRLFATSGKAFVAVWAAAVIIRLGFVWAITDWGWARMHFGEFMISHHISFDTVAPFFVIWALSMVIVRLVSVLARGAAAPKGAAILG